MVSPQESEHPPNAVIAGTITAAQRMAIAFSVQSTITAGAEMLPSWTQAVHSIRQLERLFKDEGGCPPKLLEGIVPLRQEQFDALAVLYTAVCLRFSQPFKLPPRVSETQWNRLKIAMRIVKSNKRIAEVKDEMVGQQPQPAEITEEGHQAFLLLLAALRPPIVNTILEAAFGMRRAVCDVDASRVEWMEAWMRTADTIRELTSLEGQVSAERVFFLKEEELVALAFLFSAISLWFKDDEERFNWPGIIIFAERESLLAAIRSFTGIYGVPKEKHREALARIYIKTEEKDTLFRLLAALGIQ